jgi:hypothetical protein
MGMTNAGWDAICAQIGTTGAQPAAFTYIATGTGAVAFNAADTTLGTEITDSGLARAVGTYNHTGGTKIWTLAKSFSVTGTKAVTECGVLNAASTGTLLCRQTFTAKNVVNGDTLAVTWTFTGS